MKTSMASQSPSQSTKAHAFVELQRRIIEIESPICLGIDPSHKTLPRFLYDDARRQGASEELALEEALVAFASALLRAANGLAAVCKPQIAYFEAFGIPGLKAFQRILKLAHEAGFLAIADVKRGDIGSTSKAYADAFLGETQGFKSKRQRAFEADFVTLHPYMSDDSVLPFLETALEYGRGCFVLARTSNPSAANFQSLRLDDGRQVMDVIADHIERWGESSRDRQYGLSAVGAVVGATCPEEARRMRQRMPHSFFLIPGYGAQGGVASDAVAGFREDGLGAVVNASRSIANAYQKHGLAIEDFERAARLEMIEMREKIGDALRHHV
ncbi:MAG: orotidine-5'-phosphate decarboxylase [Eubacteriales bacterium]|nr:orotidine-5'-phosphate decarboxylase [Eubacteriales bacterium]